MFVIKQFCLLFYINASGFVRAPNPLTIHCSFCATFCLANAQVAERNICRCCAHSCDGRTKRKPKTSKENTKNICLEIPSVRFTTLNS